MSGPVDHRRWAAIDFETATGERASACALGMVVVDDGEVVGQYRWLIRPPDNEFDPVNSWLHGITADDTEHAPSFREVWDEASRIVEGRVLVAHNAGFDLSVLYHSLADDGVFEGDYSFVCTLVLARRVWPGRYSYTLPVIADEVGFVFTHHDPVEDAAATAAIAAALTASHSYDLAAACAAHDIRLGQLTAAGYRGSWARDVRLSALEATVDDIDPDHPLFGKTVVFTGALESMTRSVAGQRVVNAGGQCSDSISKKVDYLVTGIQDIRKFAPGQSTSGKLRRFAQLVDQGYPIELITERDLLQLLGPK